MKRLLNLFTLGLAAGGLRGVPELAKGLSNNFETGTQELDQRVKSKFPVGTLESEVVSQLEAQGFRILPSSEDEEGLWHDATYYRRDVFFTTVWSIRWRSLESRLTEIWAVYGTRGP